MRSAGGRLLVASAIVALLLSGCGGDDANTSPPSDITVASFDFAESRVIGELYAQALEDTGLRVERAIGGGPREVLQPALEQGAIDVVPEYTGTALEFLNKGAGEASTDSDATYAKLQAALGRRKLVALQPAPGQNQSAVGVTRETADRLGLRTISDLRADAADLVFGGPPECATRSLCLQGLQRRYGLRFKEFRPLDTAGPYTLGALRDGVVGAALVFTTTPALADGLVVALVDDKGLQPAEHIVPVVRAAALARHPEVRTTLDAVSAELTTADLVDLNRALERGDEPADVARRWLEGHELIH